MTTLRLNLDRVQLQFRLAVYKETHLQTFHRGVCVRELYFRWWVLAFNHPPKIRSQGSLVPLSCEHVRAVCSSFPKLSAEPALSSEGLPFCWNFYPMLSFWIIGNC